MGHQWVTNESWITIRGRPQLDSEQQNPRMPHGAQRGDFLTCQVFELFDLWHAGAGAKWQAFRIRVRLKCTQVSVTEWHRGNITVIWVILWGTGRYSGKMPKRKLKPVPLFFDLASLGSRKSTGSPGQIKCHSADGKFRKLTQLHRLHTCLNSWVASTAQPFPIHPAPLALHGNFWWPLTAPWTVRYPLCSQTPADTNPKGSKKCSALNVSWGSGLHNAPMPLYMGSVWHSLSAVDASVLKRAHHSRLQFDVAPWHSRQNTEHRGTVYLFIQGSECSHLWVPSPKIHQNYVHRCRNLYLTKPLFHFGMKGMFLQSLIGGQIYSNWCNRNRETWNVAMDAMGSSMKPCLAHLGLKRNTPRSMRSGDRFAMWSTCCQHNLIDR